MRTTIFLCALACFAACKERSSNEPTNAASSTTSNANDTSTSTTKSGAPTWTRDVLPHIEKTCAVENGCHGENPTESIDLDLRPAAAYRSLVNHPSSVRPSALLVAPGDASKSFVVDKLRGKLGAKEGKAMPLDAETGAPKPATADDRAFVDDVLVPWIDAGALEK